MPIDEDWALGIEVGLGVELKRHCAAAALHRLRPWTLCV